MPGRNLLFRHLYGVLHAFLLGLQLLEALLGPAADKLRGIQLLLCRRQLRFQRIYPLLLGLRGLLLRFVHFCRALIFRLQSLRLFLFAVHLSFGLFNQPVPGNKPALAHAAARHRPAGLQHVPLQCHAAERKRVAPAQFNGSVHVFHNHRAPQQIRYCRLCRLFKGNQIHRAAEYAPAG